MSTPKYPVPADQTAGRNADLIAAFAGLLDARGRDEADRINFYSGILAEHGLEVRFAAVESGAAEERGES